MIYKTKKKYKAVLAVLLSLVLLLTSCGAPEAETNHTEEAKSDNLLIGFSFDSFLIERWQRDCDVFVSEVKELDPEAEVNVQNANGDI